MGEDRSIRLLWLAALVWAPTAPAEQRQEVYVSTGEHGETSFSDVAAPGAERLVVTAVEPLDDPLAELERRIEQSLSVARALEESRRAREAARAGARDHAAPVPGPVEPQVVRQQRYQPSPYLFPYVDGYPPRPFRPRGPRDDGAPEAPDPVIRKSFPMKD